MAKKYSIGKKKNIKSRNSVTYGYTPKGLDFKKENLHLFFAFIAWLIVCAGIYITAVHYEFRPIMIIYSIAGAVLFICYYIANGGIKQRDFSEMQKPPEMGYDEFHTLLEHLKKRQHYKKYLFAAFIPFPLILLCDYMIIFWIPRLMS